MNLGILFALLSPFFYALMNVFDKFIVAHRIKHLFSYVPVVGIVHFSLAVLVGIFLNWSRLSFSAMVFPLVVGILGGFATFFYYFLLNKEDASHMVGMLYVYPVLVALFSFIFLHEVIGIWGYFGVFLVVVGCVLLSLRVLKFSKKGVFFSIGALIFIVALQEMFVKVSTLHVNVLQALVLNGIGIGLTLQAAFFTVETRDHFKSELKNLKWALFIESFTIVAALFLFLAMQQYPATIVAAIASIQPLYLLVFEYIINARMGRILRDEALWPKAIALVLVVLGVVVLSFNS